MQEPVEQDALDREPDATPSEPLVVASPAPVTAGVALRTAREERGLSVADVAQIIRFSPRQIEALEADDYASLPGATAVRGFVRSYAKLLKIDAVPLLANLDPAVPAPEADVRPPTNMGEAEQPSLIERVPPRAIAAGFVLLVVGLAAFWFLTRPESASEPVATPAVVAPQTAVAVPAATVVAPAVLPAEPSSAAADAATPPAAASAPASATTTVAPAPVSTSGLRVEFDDRSWIEIRDAAQKVVFVGEYPAGTKQNVDGKAPFQIWIGKASGVRMSMAGRNIDLKPHTREEVARLTVE